MEDVKHMITAADQASAKGKKPSNASLIELFRALRKSNIQRPDIVVKYGAEVLKSGGVNGIEVWSLYEQVYIAALEFGDIDLVDQCSKQLCKKFPGSVRVRRLLGMQYEYNGEYNLALDLYDTLLAENPSNLLVLKRKVCAYKSKGDLKAAVLEIHKILKIIYGDQGLWLELADIHMSMGDYQEASFCMEELVLQDPHNAAFNSRLADLYYTLGGFDYYMKSRKHYTMSLNLQCPRLNLRALYGLISAAKGVENLLVGNGGSIVIAGSGVSFSEHEKAVNTQLLSWGYEQLQSIQNFPTVNDTTPSLMTLAAEIL